MCTVAKANARFIDPNAPNVVYRSDSPFDPLWELKRSPEPLAMSGERVRIKQSKTKEERRAQAFLFEASIIRGWRRKKGERSRTHISLMV